MTKILILLVCILGLISFTNADDLTAVATAGKDKYYCNFFFTANAQHSRKPKTFVDVVSTSKPISKNKSLKDEGANNNLDYIEYNGTACVGVVLKIWSGANYRGSSTVYTLKRNDGRIELDDYWSDNASSYRITLKK